MKLDVIKKLRYGDKFGFYDAKTGNKQTFIFSGRYYDQSGTNCNYILDQNQNRYHIKGITFIKRKKWKPEKEYWVMFNKDGTNPRIYNVKQIDTNNNWIQIKVKVIKG